MEMIEKLPQKIETRASCKTLKTLQRKEYKKSQKTKFSVFSLKKIENELDKGQFGSK